MRRLTCPDIEPWLDLYLDRQLDPLAEAIVRAHLETCPACQRLVQQRLYVDDALHAWAAKTTPAVDPAAVASLREALLTEHRSLARQVPGRGKARVGGLAAAARLLNWTGRAALAAGNGVRVGAAAAGTSVRLARQAGENWRRTATATKAVSALAVRTARLAGSGTRLLAKGALALG